VLNREIGGRFIESSVTESKAFDLLLSRRIGFMKLTTGVGFRPGYRIGLTNILRDILREDRSIVVVRGGGSS
jgi:hypothetical protein